MYMYVYIRFIYCIYYICGNRFEQQINNIGKMISIVFKGFLYTRREKKLYIHT